MTVRTVKAGLALLLAVGLAAASPGAAQQGSGPLVVRLWPDGAPGAGERRNQPEVARDWWIKNVNDPTLTAFPADPRHANGAAINVVPGGGHREIVWTSEGPNVARVLNRMGIAAYVLKYRLANEEGSTYSVEDAAADTRRAIRWLRANAEAQHVDPDRIGVMGFSAGGELVTMVADNPDPPASRAADPQKDVSARPDFQVLVFPGPGGQPASAVSSAPPAFLVAGSLDQCCGAPTVALYEQLRKAGISAELHMYAGADHAFNIDETDLVGVLHWPDRLADWMADSGLMDERSAQGTGPAGDKRQ
ncbi:alpha/beta hydrolase fold domain-containing protein [Altererythrobacter salegens]|uniref:Alpha/beta hydrolase fold domain-containing protein n=1 Tax=Croceibacterium salegens TaxID=1737568 RepID=A0A6I4STY5_9SPHN|nr:alpha/beta hydrolase [Croceibacterium salegens]MXO58848.1 alpha/beta hydrolase fold domain-containing protein [Croceibacterium salegens]